MSDLPEDPRLVPGAYITHSAHLYEVVSYTTAGMKAGQLLVENCKTLKRLTFLPRDLDGIELVRAAPTLDVPDSLAAA
jgi:hypothetical protein